MAAVPSATCCVGALRPWTGRVPAQGLSRHCPGGPAPADGGPRPRLACPVPLSSVHRRRISAMMMAATATRMTNRENAIALASPARP